MKKSKPYMLWLVCVLLLFTGCEKHPVDNTENAVFGQMQETQPTQNTQPTQAIQSVQTDPTPRTLPEGTPLTVDELTWFNDEFFSGLWVDEDTKWFYNIRNMYMQMEFTDVMEIDMGFLFRNGVRTTKEQVTQEEINALQQVTGKAVSGEVIKIPKWDMEIAFLHTTGKSFQNAPKNGLEKFVYLEKYDAYYGEITAIESPRYEIKEGVKLQGGQTVVLLYQHKQSTVANDWLVTLRHHDGNYWFASNLPCSD